MRQPQLIDTPEDNALLGVLLAVVIARCKLAARHNPVAGVPLHCRGGPVGFGTVPADAGIRRSSVRPSKRS